ncbi:hypothetical protein ACFQ9B_45570, partial [Streptomyces sp. NPDC056549]
QHRQRLNTTNHRPGGSRFDRPNWVRIQPPPTRLGRVWAVTGNLGRWSEVDQDGGIEGVALLILEWLGEQGPTP